MHLRFANGWRYLLPILAGCVMAAGPVLAGDDGHGWRRGVEHQRMADLGDGRYLNPVLAGDHPDPSVLKDGRDYYLTLSSFDAYPGLPIWHSRDLVNWQPLAQAIRTDVGSIWAPDLVKVKGRYYIYFAARSAARRGLYVVWADAIAGPWSEPVSLGLPGHIDPGHAVGEDGRRYLFLSGGDYVALSDDGLRVVGKPTHAYDGWQYPENWDVESFSLEGPKISRRGGWFYLTMAEGGTAGPPTGHMVISARSRSIHGPWQNSPYNPVVHTASRDEAWWSRGHATVVEGSDGRDWLVYHGYENGYWTLGRQMLLDPIAWTADGWFVARGGDLGQPLAKPAGEALPHGMALSDDFRGDRLGRQWTFFKPGPQEYQRLSFGPDGMVLRGEGHAPRDSSPLLVTAGDQAYSFEVEMQIAPGAIGGAVLFYDQHLYAGLGSNGDSFVLHRYGQERPATPLPPGKGGRLWLRLTNDRHILTIHTSRDGRHWRKYPVQMEVSGYHHNVAGGFLALKPGLYAAGSGVVVLKHFRYRALN